MNETRLKELGLQDSRQTLNLYLETLFREEVVDQDESIKQQSMPAKSKDIEAMLIRLGEHKLALPVHGLKTVIKLDDVPLSHLPGQAEYVLGVVRYQGKNIPVYDLSWIFNLDNHTSVAMSDTDEPKQVIILKGEKMAIACDETDEIVQLNQHDIRWNKGGQKRRWLQGITLKHMATLLDLNQVKRAFRTIRIQDKNGTRATLA